MMELTRDDVLKTKIPLGMITTVLGTAVQVSLTLTSITLLWVFLACHWRGC